jgi:hypothetical protein
MYNIIKLTLSLVQQTAVCLKNQWQTGCLNSLKQLFINKTFKNIEQTGCLNSKKHG